MDNRIGTRPEQERGAANATLVNDKVPKGMGTQNRKDTYMIAWREPLEDPALQEFQGWPTGSERGLHKPVLRQMRLSPFIRSRIDRDRNKAHTCT